MYDVELQLDDARRLAVAASEAAWTAQLSAAAAFEAPVGCLTANEAAWQEFRHSHEQLIDAEAQLAVVQYKLDPMHARAAAALQEVAELWHSICETTGNLDSVSRLLTVPTRCGGHWRQLRAALASGVLMCSVIHAWSARLSKPNDDVGHGSDLMGHLHLHPAHDRGMCRCEVAACRAELEMEASRLRY